MIFFLNSTNRVYNDKELNVLPGILFGDGVFNTKAATQALWKTAGDFLVEASGEDMNITARAGVASALVTSGGSQQRIIIKEDAQLSASVASNPSLPVRADAVVLRILQSIITNDQLNAGGTNAVSLVVVSGNSATALTDQEISVALGGDNFIRLADLYVPQSVTEVNNAMLTDARTLVTMTRSVKFETDSIRLFALENDPTSLREGQIWFNSSEGILKFFDGVNAIALQTQAFDWGYYPPNGVDRVVDETDAFVENVGGVSENSGQVYEIIDALGGGNYTLMWGQLFKMPDIPNPFIRVKMGNPEYQCAVAFKIYTVNGSNVPQALIENPLSLSAENVPKNDYVNLYLDGSLYNPGQTYMLVFQSTAIGYINAGDSSFITGMVRYSTFTDDSGYLLGTKNSSLSSLTTNPLSLPWSGATTTTRNFIMSIAKREELEFGKTDATTNVHKLSQVFIPKSRDIIAFRVIKGAEVGSPIDDINASLYEADENNEPIGNVLTTATIAEADWLEGGSGTEKDFELQYDNLIVGQKYVVVIEVENYSDTDNYTIYFGGSENGTAKRWNTADGWTSLDGNLFYATVTSPNRKIVVTNDQGKIPTNLFNESELIALLPDPAYDQDLAPTVLDALTTSEDSAFGSNEDGSVCYMYNGKSGSSGAFYRFEKDLLTGKFFQTHRITPTLQIPNSDNGAIVQVGIYVYLFSNNGTNVVCSRFLAANLTGETALTVPTLACTTNVTAWTDGEFLYVVSATSSTVSNKWEIAGTTLNAISTATVSSNLVGPNRSSMWDGENAFVLYFDTNQINIYKLTLVDGSTMDTSTKVFAKDIFSDTYTGGFIINIDDDRMYVGFEMVWWNELNADVSRGNIIKLMPVTKP